VTNVTFGLFDLFPGGWGPRESKTAKRSIFESMTLQEQFDRERNNLDRVYLTPEGAFLKAYERSAFILDTQWHPFKVSVKTVKYLKAEIASLGFGKQGLCRLEEAGFQRIAENVYQAKHPVTEQEFQAWKTKKSSVPIGAPAPEKPDFNLADAIRSFPLESSSPIDCMIFVASLKKKLAHPDGTL